MAPVGKVRAGLRANRLRPRRQPAFGALPARKVQRHTVESIRAKGTVADSQQHVACAQRSADHGLGGDGQVAVIAIREEARGKLAHKRQLFAELLAREGQRSILLVRAPVADARAQTYLARLRHAGDKVHRPAHGIRAVQRGARALQHFHPLHGRERERNVQVVVPGLGVIQTQSIDKDQCFFKRRAADGKIRRSSRRPLLHVERRVLLEDIDPVAVLGRGLSHLHGADAAVGFLQRHRAIAARHHHCSSRRGNFAWGAFCAAFWAADCAEFCGAAAGALALAGDCARAAQPRRKTATKYFSWIPFGNEPSPAPDRAGCRRTLF